MPAKVAAATADNSMQFLKGSKVMDYPIYDITVSKQAMATMLAAYLLMVVVLRKFMAGRSPYALNFAMKVYNTAQVALNVYMIWGLCVLSSPTNIFGINEKYTSRLEYFVWVHYMSKFLDDAWMVEKGLEPASILTKAPIQDHGKRALRQCCYFICSQDVAVIQHLSAFRQPRLNQQPPQKHDEQRQRSGN